MLIQYDGIGCNGSKNLFTEYEFLKIMNDTVTHKDWKNVPEFVKRVQLYFKDWIEYSGAKVVDSDGDRTRNL